MRENPDFAPSDWLPVNQWRTEPANRCRSFVEGFILKWETSYAKGHDGDDNYVLTEHDPADTGGTTRYGIDQASHPHTDVEHLTREGAIAIYASEWARENIEAMPDKVGEVFFNAAVNAGLGRAQKLLVASHGVAARFLDEQEGFYRRLVAAKPAFKRYLNGWLNRTGALRRYLWQ